MDLNHLPGDLAQFVQQEVAAGRFASVEEVVSAALRLLQGRDAQGGNGPATSVAQEPSPQVIKRRALHLSPHPFFDGLNLFGQTTDYGQRTADGKGLIRVGQQHIDLRLA
jgi:putative addiction module CopG family antidote